ARVAGGLDAGLATRPQPRVRHDVGVRYPFSRRPKPRARAWPRCGRAGASDRDHEQSDQGEAVSPTVLHAHAQTGVATVASEFQAPGPSDFWQPLVGDGAWALTRPGVMMLISVLVLGVFYV